MGKHAYLIIANRNPNQLNLLLKTIDDSRNDIYLLIDKKSISNFNRIFKPRYSILTMVDPLNIFGGDYSLISAELRLFSVAKSGNYDYYHLLSGLDLPLVNQDIIHSFFDKYPNKEFITYSAALSSKQLSIRLHKYHFTNSFRTKNKLLNCYHKIEFKLYSKLPEKKIDLDKLSFGSNWVSLDDELVSDLVKHKDLIYDLYHRGFLVDEVFIPTFINMYPKYKKKIFYSKSVTDKPNEFQENLRYINWWDGKPYTWRLKDYPKLEYARNNGHMFSRKFDENIDNKIIQKIVNYDLGEYYESY